MGIIDVDVPLKIKKSCEWVWNYNECRRYLAVIAVRLLYLWRSQRQAGRYGAEQLSRMAGGSKQVYLIGSS